VPASVAYDVFSPGTPLSLTLHTDGATWVTATLNQPVTPAVVTISVSPAALPAGAYTSTV